MSSRRRKCRSVSEIMSRIRSKGTKPELRVRAWLWSHGFRYRKNVRSLPGTPDVVLPGARVAIFVHGCFWHQHPGCASARIPNSNVEFWTHKFERNVSRDVSVREALRRVGWRTMVLWECQLSDSELEATMTRVAYLVSEAREEWLAVRRHRSFVSSSISDYDDSDSESCAYAAEDDELLG